jgi:hypothetical protein
MYKFSFSPSNIWFPRLCLLEVSTIQLCSKHPLMSYSLPQGKQGHPPMGQMD